MLFNPSAGQIVRHENFDERMIVKSVESAGVVVELCLASNEDRGYPDLPLTMVFHPRELYLT